MKKMTYLAMLLLLLVTASGCGLTSKQVVSVQSFGSATASIGQFGESEFVHIRNGIIEMNQALLTIDNKKTSNKLQFDRPANTQATAVRVAASKALRLYGELLVLLATTDRTANLQKVANSLLDNTAAALDEALSEDQKEAMSGLIVGLGSFWIENKKANAAKEIIPAYEDSVNRLADLLREDFSLDDGSLGYLKAYEATAKRLKNAAMRLVNAGGKYNVLERERAVHALVVAEKAVSRAGEINKKTKYLVSKLKKANAELVKAMQQQHYSVQDIKAYAKQMQELANIYQVLGN